MLSLICGSLLALNQRNIRRLRAYVGVAQVRVALLGLLAVNETGLMGVLFGAVAAALALAGCYAIMAMCGPESPDLRDYNGGLGGSNRFWRWDSRFVSRRWPVCRRRRDLWRPDVSRFWFMAVCGLLLVCLHTRQLPIRQRCKCERKRWSY